MTPATHHILGQERPRVWSFIVTIFGDLAREDSHYISSRTLNRLTAQIGVKPEATRVALHRLRKEDWLESTKFGRESHYRLTENGRALSREAAPRIYGAASDEAWMLALYDPNMQFCSLRAILVCQNANTTNFTMANPLPLWMVTDWFRLMSKAPFIICMRVWQAFRPNRMRRNSIVRFCAYHWCMNGAASFCVFRMFLIYCLKTHFHLGNSGVTYSVYCQRCRMYHSNK